MAEQLLNRAKVGAAIEQVAHSATALRETLESSTSALHEMGQNIATVAASTDSVQEVAEETASSIMEMDHTIQEVGNHVRGASELTERVSEAADDGSRAVGATIEGIAEIRDVTRGAKTALEGLAARIAELASLVVESPDAQTRERLRVNLNAMTNVRNLREQIAS